MSIIGRTSLTPPDNPERTTAQPSRRKTRTAKWAGALAVALLLIAIAIPVALTNRPAPPGPSTQRISYLGLYERSMPGSYAGAAAFTAATGIRPNILMYYSGWETPFQASFATAAAQRRAVPLIQINPKGVSLPAIAAGRYDGYLIRYAEAVRAYRHPVILSFGHEMNGNWYSWGNTHASPAAFVAAWQHIVTLFRQQGAGNVTWLWTVNIMQPSGSIPSPRAWWPGRSYVTWVGIDGYYYQPSWTFASLFGPTIAAVRAFTHDPILISETAAAQGTQQPAKIADLFAGVHLYGLLGFVWFDARTDSDWRLRSPAAIAAFRLGARSYRSPTS